MISKNLSLKGWNKGIWFKKNWPKIKDMIKLMTPVVTGVVAMYPQLWPLFGSLPLVILGKCVLDIAEFYFMKVNLSATHIVTNK